MNTKQPTKEQVEEQKRLLSIAVENAKPILKRGDKLRVTRCPNTKRTITFECWCGCWIVSKSGIDDIHPINVDRINGKPVDFTVTETN